MPRRVLVLLALVIGASAFVSRPPESTSAAAFAAAPDAAPTLRTTRTILVTLKCETRSGWVNDSTLHAAPGDTITFELTPESDVTEFMVKRKTPVFGRWLFRRNEIVGRPGNPGRGDDMKPGAKGTYRYKVIGICRGGPNAIIDPDIIIDLDT